MNRRTFLGRVAAIGAAVAVPPAVKTEAAPELKVRQASGATLVALTDDGWEFHEDIQEIIADVVANPDKHPEVWQRVRELTGDGSAKSAREPYAPPGAIVVGDGVQMHGGWISAPGGIHVMSGVAELVGLKLTEAEA